MLNSFSSVSESERNAVNATLKKVRVGVRALWTKCDLFVVSEVFQQIWTERAVADFIEIMKRLDAGDHTTHK